MSNAQKKLLNYLKLDMRRITENLRYTIPTIIFFLVITTYIFTLSKLDVTQYSNNLLLSIFLGPSFLISVGISVYLVYKKIHYRLFDKHVQYIIKSCIILFSIVYATYSYNYYYNQWHILERLILILLGIAATYRLALIIPFTSYLCSIIYQFNHPSFLSYTWTDKILLVYVLILFVSYCLTISLYVKRRLQNHYFIFILLCMLGSNYFFPGVAKIFYSPTLIEWALHNKLSLLLINAWMGGFLNFLSEPTILMIGSLLATFNIIMTMGALVFEQLCGLFILFHKKLTKIYLFLVCTFHITVFLVSGIFFWKWIILNVFIFLWLCRDDAYKLFNKENFVISILVIIFSIFYFAPAAMHWYDTPYVNTFDIILHTKDSSYNVSKNALRPYDASFAQNRFHALYDGKLLVRIFGITKDYEIAKNLYQASTVSDILDLKEKYGVNDYNTTYVKEFDRFINTYFNHFNTDRSNLEIQLVPDHITTSLTNVKLHHVIPENENVTAVSIKLTEIWNNEGELILINEAIIHTVNITNQPANYSEIYSNPVNFDYPLHYGVKKVGRIGGIIYNVVN